MAETLFTNLDRKSQSETEYTVIAGRSFISDAKHKPNRITFDILRELRAVNSLANVCIETQKHSIISIPWFVTIKNENSTNKHEKAKAAFERLVRKPNSIDSYRTFWLKVLEDILVIDRGAVEKVYTGKGMLAELIQVDGATVLPKIDDTGELMSPAYTQEFQNEVLAQFEEDEISILMNSPTSNLGTTGYGKSPIERILLTITTYLQSENFNSQVFTQNSLPPYMVNLPEATKDQISMLREAWEANTLGKMWKGLFLNAKDMNVQKLRDSNAEMQYYELTMWLARITIAAFEMSPQDVGLTFDVNRATADSQREISKNQGLRNLLFVISEFYNNLLDEMSMIDSIYSDLNFSFEEIDKADEKIQAEVHKIYIDSGVLTVDEVRKKKGLDPLETQEVEEKEETVNDEEVIETKSIVKKQRKLTKDERKVDFMSISSTMDEAKEQIMNLVKTQLISAKPRVIKTITEAVAQASPALIANLVTIPSSQILFQINDILKGVHNSSIVEASEEIDVSVTPQPKTEELLQVQTNVNVNDMLSKLDTNMQNLGATSIANGYSEEQITEGVNSESDKWLNTTASLAAGALVYDAVAQSREQVFKDDKVIGYRFSAVLDNSTTEFCRSMDGSTFKKGDTSRPKLPQHYHERSIYIPILTSDNIDNFTIEEPKDFVTLQDFQDGDAFEKSTSTIAKIKEALENIL